VLLGFVTFMFKVIVMLFFQFVVRWALPRFRYDQLMHLGWRIMLPLSLANIGVTALAMLLGGDEAVMGIGLAILGVFFVSLFFQRKPHEEPVHHAVGAH